MAENRGQQLAMALLPLLLCFTACAVAAEETKMVASEGEGSWCIARPSSSNEALQNNIDYSCAQAEVDCRAIQAGGGCFYPRNPTSHASFAMNLFYKAARKHAWDCYFNGTGLIVTNNPSIGSCNYPT